MASCQHYYSDLVLKLFTFSKDQGHRAQQFLFYGALGPFWTITTSRIVDYNWIVEQKLIIDILSKSSLTTLSAYGITNAQYSVTIMKILTYQLFYLLLVSHEWLKANSKNTAYLSKYTNYVSFVIIWF